MNFWATSKSQAGGCRLLVTSLMLMLWLGTFALTSSPELHHLLHTDSQSASHHCLITQLQQHSMLTACAFVVVPAPPCNVAVSLFCTDYQFPAFRDYRLAPSRAPPSSVSSMVVG